MNKSQKYFADDRVLIPEDIKSMSKEELRREIIRLENKTKNQQSIDDSKRVVTATV